MKMQRQEPTQVCNSRVSSPSCHLRETRDVLTVHPPCFRSILSFIPLIEKAWLVFQSLIFRRVVGFILKCEPSLHGTPQRSEDSQELFVSPPRLFNFVSFFSLFSFAFLHLSIFFWDYTVGGGGIRCADYGSPSVPPWVSLLSFVN